MIKKGYVLACLFPLLAYGATPGEQLWQLLAQTIVSEKTTCSKLDDLSVDLTGVFTSLNTICDQLKSEISTLDSVAVASSVAPFSSIALIESKLEESLSLIDPIQSYADLLDDCIGTPITQADVGTTGYSITTGGKYFLAENITFSPASGIPAIEIDADNVTLDLNGFTITQGNMQMGVRGILVIGGHRDINVQNGTIRNTLGEGITFLPTFTNVHINNLNVLNAGVGPGGSIDGVDGIMIGDFGMICSNLVIENCLIDGCQDDGIDIVGVTNVIINNCKVSNARSSGLVLKGLDRNVMLKDSVFFNNEQNGISLFGDGSTSFNFAGKNMVVSRCEVFSNKQHGIVIGGIESGGGICILNCDIYNNAVYGVRFFQVQTENCVVSQNYIANNGSDGIRLENALNNNNFFFRNTIVENGGNSINNAAGAVNSFLGNYAFKSSGTNYVAGGSVINATTVTTSSAFGTQPAFWRNIDATP